MSSSEAYVSFQGVQKSYDGETLVVKDLNLDTQRGEFLTMLGPSGSGKTTCLMMLAGFETVTHGEIILDGTSINSVPPHKRNIGMVFQNYALFPHMTVNENLAFPLEVRKLNTAGTIIITYQIPVFDNFNFSSLEFSIFNNNEVGKMVYDNIQIKFDVWNIPISFSISRN